MDKKTAAIHYQSLADYIASVDKLQTQALDAAAALERVTDERDALATALKAALAAAGK